MSCPSRYPNNPNSCIPPKKNIHRLHLLVIVSATQGPVFLSNGFGRAHEQQAAKEPPARHHPGNDGDKAAGALRLGRFSQADKYQLL